jgi:hypothetical protein
MRIAWKVRVAGSVFCPGRWPTARRTIAASLPVRSIGRASSRRNAASLQRLRRGQHLLEASPGVVLQLLRGGPNRLGVLAAGALVCREAEALQRAHMLALHQHVARGRDGIGRLVIDELVRAEHDLDRRLRFLGRTLLRERRRCA